MGDDFPKLKAAAVQASPVFMDRDATVEKACRLIEEAGDEGAQLVVFPEVFIPAFPYWAPMSPSAPHDHARRAWSDLYKNSVEIPSESTGKLGAAARRAGATVIMGLNEREVGRSATLYNTLLYLGPDGEIMGRHRKLIPTGHERTVWGRGDGSDLQVYELDNAWRVSGLVCGENLMTLSKATLLAMGEQVHAMVWPSFRGRADWIQTVCRAYAIEGQTFVVVACGIHTADNIPDEFPLKSETNFSGNGGSAIIGPGGNYLAGPTYDNEVILYADLDFDQILAAKSSIDGVGHYARYDVARIALNQRRNSPFVELPAAAAAPSGELTALAQRAGDLPRERLVAEIKRLAANGVDTAQVDAPPALVGGANGHGD